MKLSGFLCFFLLVTRLLIAQDINNSRSIVFNAGVITHPDIWVKENNNMLELSFFTELSKDFAYEVFINRSFSNSTKPFFNDDAKLIAYLNDNDLGLFDWQKIETYSTGLKGHFFFINKPKAEFSFYLGSGVHFSKSSEQVSKSIGYSLETDEITSVEQAPQRSENRVKPFVMPGLFFRYWIWKDIALGINAMSFFEIDGREVITEPVQANFFSLAFNVSYKL